MNINTPTKEKNIVIEALSIVSSKYFNKRYNPNRQADKYNGN